MKRLILFAVFGALIVSVTMSLLMATDDDARRVFDVDEDGHVKLLLDQKNNYFALEDENRTYNLFNSLVLKLYKGDNKLYKDTLGAVKIVSISKKYSDLDIYVIKYEFSVFRCALDVTEVCETDRGASKVEVYLGRESFNEPLTMLSMPELEIMALW